MDMQFDVSTIEGRSTLWLDSNRLAECMDYFRDYRIDVLGINPVRGFKEQELGFLRQFPWIQAVLVVAPASHDFDLAPVFELKDLRELILNQGCSYSLADLPRLEVFRGNWNAALSLDHCRKLRALSITGYKGGDLMGFPAPATLEELSMVQCSMKSLAGIGRFKNLQRLELAYLTKLEDIGNLPDLLSLQFLELNKCKKVRWHSIVSNLKELKVLRFNDCGTIPDLQFINEMTSLEEFRFVNTLIEDGDLRPLLRLKRVGFLSKKGYSHSPKDFPN